MRIQGITPAYAGRIKIQYVAIRQGQDHPRIRGKNKAIKLTSSAFIGSPPHTREEFKSPRFPDLVPRITPAYAGRISFFELCDNVLWDHPRIRGKNAKIKLTESGT